MRLLTLFSLTFFIGVLFYQCTRNSTVPIQYPNESSELALLMREMEAEAITMREAINKGKEPKDVRERFAAILVAKSTEASMKTPAFQAMANNYLKSLDKIYQTPQNERMAKYNIMINDCMNCHKTNCPGPLVRIKKLTTK